MRKFVLGIGLLLASALPASAAEWISAAKSATGVEYFVDMASLKAGTTRQVAWVKWVMPPPIKTGTPGHVVARFSFDCSALTYTRLSIIGYDPKGNVLASQTIEPYRQKAEMIAPDTVFEDVASTVCGVAAP